MSKSRSKRKGTRDFSQTKRTRYFSQRLNGHHISRALVPRMREYLSVTGSSVVDIEKMALDLQAQHSEYSRKKKAVFQRLVGEVYDNYKTELGVADHGCEQLTQSVREGGGREEEKGGLSQREMEHLKKDTDNADQDGLENADTAEKDSTSCHGEDEFQAPNYNILNNSLIQIYKTNIQRTDDSGPAVSGSPSATNTTTATDRTIQVEIEKSPPATTNSTTDEMVEIEKENSTLCSSSTTDASTATDGMVKLEKESSTAVALSEPPCRSDVTRPGSGQHVSEAEASVRGDNVEPHPKSHPDLPDQSPETSNNALSTNTEPGILLPSVSMDTTGEYTESAPISAEEPNVTGKKVWFSTPEVTSQQDYMIGEESKMRPVVKSKKKKRRHESEAPHAKRKKEEQEAVASHHLNQTRSSEFLVQSSTVRFSDVGGCGECLREVNKLLLHMKQPELFARLGVRPPQGFLLHGPPGCGKTLIANAIAGELGLPFIKLAATEIVSGVSGESEGTLRDLFQLAKDHAPCVLFIDEVDAICQKRETAQREMERRIVTQLLTCLDDLNASSCVGHVLVIGATSRPDSLDPALRRAGRFDREISIGIPDLQARLSILKVLCRGLCLEEGFNFSLVAEQSPGFVGADLSSLVTEAALCAVNRVLSAHRQRANSHSELAKEGVECCDLKVERVGSISEGTGGARIYSFQMEPLLTQQQLEATFISTADFLSALECVQPSAKREGFATVPNTTWEDVGALEGIREELSMAILAPVRYPQQFASLGLSSPPGVLLAGPPGCGKTLLAKAIANESGINFISVKGPELLNMYVGESERAVRQVFQRARNSSPCVIFFDELDALCPKRSEMAETSASARVVNQLLTEMDGLEARRQVFIMAATNRPDIIDPAVLRPGRLDKILYVGLPCPSDRAAILHTITKGGHRPTLDPDVDLQVLASDEHCKGFSGADLAALVREASIDALKEHMSLNPLHLTGAVSASTTAPAIDSPQPPQLASEEECVVCMRHFTNALKKIHPSVSVKDQSFYRDMAVRFSSSNS